MQRLQLQPERSSEVLAVLRTGSILIVDDEEDHLFLLSRALRQAGCEKVSTESNPFKVVETFRAVEPELVLLDYRLPPLDGFQILDELWTSVPVEERTPVIMITGGAEDSVRLKALERGVSDFIQSTSDILEIVFRVRNVLSIHHLYRTVHRQMVNLDELVRLRTSELESARREVLDRLAIAAEFRDDQTGDHARRVGSLSRLISEEMSMDRDYCESIASAALLHDLGKIAIPDSVLLKPAALTPEEFEVIRQHPSIGARILFGCDEPVLSMAREIALTHHERWDGRGYPNRLVGIDIPLSGRIVAVADAYDAMTSMRPYKDPMPADCAVREIFRCRGAQFDPKVVAAFLKVVRRLPSLRLHAA